MKNTENIHFWHEKSSECSLCISDVPETYVENSPYQRFGFNQSINWSDAIYPNLGYPRQKPRKSTF